MTEETDILEVDKESANDLLDQAELCMAESGLELANCPVTHRFTDGLYSREIFMPAGSLIVSKIHKTEHQYCVSWGKVSVWTEEDGEVVFEAPCHGITKPGTRRVLFCHTDVLWTTYHPNPNNENVEQIEERIIEKHDNKLLSEGQKEFFRKQNKLMQEIVAKSEKLLHHEN